VVLYTNFVFNEASLDLFSQVVSLDREGAKVQDVKMFMTDPERDFRGRYIGMDAGPHGDGWVPKVCTSFSAGLQQKTFPGCLELSLEAYRKKFFPSAFSSENTETLFFPCAQSFFEFDHNSGDAVKDVSEDFYFAFLVPQYLLATTMIRQYKHLFMQNNWGTLKVKNIMTRVFLACGYAIMELYRDFGQVIPVDRRLKKTCPSLYNVLLPTVPKFSRANESDADIAAFKKKYRTESLFAHISPKDSDKVTNVPAIAGFTCFCISKGKSLKMKVPTHVRTGEKQMESYVNSDGTLRPHDAIGNIRIERDFAPLFHVAKSDRKLFSLSETVQHMLSDKEALREAGESVTHKVFDVNVKKDGVEFTVEEWTAMQNDAPNWANRAFPDPKKKKKENESQEEEEEEGEEVQATAKPATKKKKPAEAAKVLIPDFASNGVFEATKVSIPKSTLKTVLGTDDANAPASSVTTVLPNLNAEIARRNELLQRMIAGHELLLKHKAETHMPVTHEYLQIPPKVDDDGNVIRGSVSSGPAFGGLTVDMLQVNRAIYQFVFNSCVLDGTDHISDPLEKLRRIRDGKVDLNLARQVMADFCAYLGSKDATWMIQSSIAQHPRDEGVVNRPGKFFCCRPPEESWSYRLSSLHVSSI
jgi:hypothetical protein